MQPGCCIDQICIKSLSKIIAAGKTSCFSLFPGIELAVQCIYSYTISPTCQFRQTAGTLDVPECLYDFRFAFIKNTDIISRRIITGIP